MYQHTWLPCQLLAASHAASWQLSEGPLGSATSTPWAPLRAFVLLEICAPLHQGRASWQARIAAAQGACRCAPLGNSPAAVWLVGNRQREHWNSAATVAVGSGCQGKAGKAVFSAGWAGSAPLRGTHQSPAHTPACACCAAGIGEASKNNRPPASCPQSALLPRPLCIPHRSKRHRRHTPITYPCPHGPLTYIARTLFRKPLPHFWQP